MRINEGGSMQGYCWKKLGTGIYLGAWILFLLSSPSFAQAPGGPPESYAVQKIEVTKSDNGPRVVIEGSKSFEYTVFRLTDPLRVVIDLPRAQLGRLAGPMEVRDGTISVIQNRQIEDPQKRGARIEIGLDQLAEYDVVSEGNLLYINFGKPAIPLPQEVKAKPAEKKEAEVMEAAPPAKPLKKARSLRGVDIAAKADWVKVDLRGDGTFPDYKSFQLSRPTRLVVDLPAMANASGKKNIDVGSRLLKEIRVGQHPDKIRVVFSFPEAKLPPYQLTKEGADLRLVLGEAPKETVKEEKAPPAEPQKPVQVAEAAPKAEVKAKEETAPPAAEKPAVKEETAPTAEIKPPEMEKSPVGTYKGTKISLDFKDADIHNIFRLIAEVSNLNIITAEDVKGKITIRLVNVPWDQALDVILATKNLVKIEEGNVLRITTAETIRREMEEKQKEQGNLIKSMENRENIEELYTETFLLNFAKAVELQKVLGGIIPGATGAKPILTSRGSARADERTNTLIVRDIRSRIDEVQSLLKKLDAPTRQVLIEARVVQATTTFARAIGVQWGGSVNSTGSTAWGLTGNNPSAAAGWGFTPNQAGGAASTNLIMPSSFVVNLPASTVNTPASGAAISFGKLTGNLVNLDMRISLGETDGSTRVIARPKLATLDNKEAHVKQGEKIPYETTSQAGTQVQFIDAVLQLKVTPQVTPDGYILMKVQVNRDARGTFRSPVNQVPSIDTREAQTEVLVKDGETLVIGGIYETETDKTEQGIPWLMQIPVLGWLFKNQEILSTKKELLIFLTPTVIIEKKSKI
jgi:type IV pilus assembly protein PilQ